MAFLLRTISKAKWIPPEWVPPGEVPASALSDLRAETNVLSLWRIEADRRNLTTVVTALASRRDRLDKLDYAIVAEAAVDAIPIVAVPVEGDTPHPTANRDHRDLIELTARKVCRLAEELSPERARVSEKEVKTLLKEALGNGTIDRAMVKPTLLRDLGELHP